MTEELTVNNTAEQPAQVELPDWLQEMTDDTPREHRAPVEQKFTTTGIIGMVLIVGLLVMIGYLLNERSKGTVTEGPAPTFAIEVFDHTPLDSSGAAIQLADLRGQVVVINFWASYCGPCRDEADMLEAVYREYKDQNVVFLGINTDDIERNALAYLDEYSISYPNAPDKGGKIEDYYRITGIPETFVINREGEITWHIPAPITDGGRALRAEIEKALRG